MIREYTGNIFVIKAQAYVNTVNCVGVMGAGIALSFKRKFPKMFSSYREMCKLGNVKVGSMTIITVPRYNEDTILVINFPTKQHWKNPSKISYIKDGMKSLVAEIKRLGIKSIAIPHLGCNNGGLSWKDVKPIVYEALEPISEEVEITVVKYGR